MPKINATWHRQHPMPKNPTAEDRMAWHQEHAEQCGCRPIPARIAALMKRALPPLPSPRPSARPSTRRYAAKRARLAAPAQQSTLARLRALCLALPDATEVEAWGHPTFRVADKIFAGFGEEDGVATLGVKTTLDRQATLVGTDPRFTIARYVGKHGWVSMTLAGTIDWNEVEARVRESYELVGNKRRR